MVHTVRLTFTLLAVLCICSYVLGQDDCQVPNEPRFKGFIGKEKKNYPREDAEMALMEYPEIAEAVAQEAKTRRDDRDPMAGNAIDDLAWNIHCPTKLKNLQYFGIRDDRDPMAGNAIDDLAWNIHCPTKLKNLQYFGIRYSGEICWVLTPLWVAYCRTETCAYTFVFQNYYLCRPRYMPVQFWAYCPANTDAPFKLFLRYVPKYCDCRRYFCGEETNPLPVDDMPPIEV